MLLICFFPLNCNKRKLIDFLLHFPFGEIDGPAVIINRRVCSKNPLLLTLYNPCKILCNSHIDKNMLHAVDIQFNKTLLD